MRAKLFLLLIVSLSLLLSGCGFDESWEDKEQHDGDDIDVIGTIGPQALDQMLLGLDVPVVEQTPVVLATPSYAPSLVSEPSVVQQPVVQQPVVQQPVVQQPVIISTPPSFVEDNREENHQEDREGDDD